MMNLSHNASFNQHIRIIYKYFSHWSVLHDDLPLTKHRGNFNDLYSFNILNTLLCDTQHLSTILTFTWMSLLSFTENYTRLKSKLFGSCENPSLRNVSSWEKFWNTQTGDVQQWCSTPFSQPTTSHCSNRSVHLHL